MEPAVSSPPFRRVYMDLPAEVADKAKERARELGMTVKDYLGSLIAADVGGTKKRTKKGRK